MSKDLVGAWCWVWDREGDPQTEKVIVDYKEGKKAPYMEKNLVTWKYARAKTPEEVQIYLDKAKELYDN